MRDFKEVFNYKVRDAQLTLYENMIISNIIKVKDKIIISFK